MKKPTPRTKLLQGPGALGGTAPRAAEANAARDALATEVLAGRLGKRVAVTWGRATRSTSLFLEHLHAFR